MQYWTMVRELWWFPVMAIKDLPKGTQRGIIRALI
jgi:hypothetical protein